MKDSDSSAQKEIEAIVLKKLELNPQKITISNISFNFDGFSEEKSIIAEVYAGINELKSAQRQKVSQDILKMILFEKLTGKTYKKVFAVIDKSIFNALDISKSNSWKNLAFKEYNIEIQYIEISDKDRKKLKDAKEKQGKKFIGKQ